MKTAQIKGKSLIFLLLTGCTMTATGPLDATINTSWAPVTVKTKLVGEKTYDMTPWPADFHLVSDRLDIKTAFREAVMRHAGELCGTFTIVGEDQTNLLIAETPPRYRVRCD